MSKVIQNKIWDIIKEKRRQKRMMSYQTVSLDALLEYDDDDECVGHIASDEESFKEVFKSDVGDVLEQTLSSLSRRQQELCRLFRDEGLSIREASRRLKIPRTSLSEEIRRIREVFREEGLTDYLQ